MFTNGIPDEITAEKIVHLSSLYQRPLFSTLPHSSTTNPRACSLSAQCVFFFISPFPVTTTFKTCNHLHVLAPQGVISSTIPTSIVLFMTSSPDENSKMTLLGRRFGWLEGSLEISSYGTINRCSYTFFSFCLFAPFSLLFYVYCG